MAQTAGHLEAWRIGRVLYRSGLRSARTAASVSLPDLGPWDTGLEFPSQGALAHALCTACSSLRATRSRRSTPRRPSPLVGGESGPRKPAAGAGHAFSKAGIDDSTVSGLAGPELLVSQMGTWLPLWLDGRRAKSKQLADQEDWGELLPRPSLEEVDAVCKTFKSTAGLGHVCVNPKAILQPPDDLRVRFIDLLVAFEANLRKPLSLGTHDGSEAQATRRPPHHRPHSGTAARANQAETASGAAMGDRARRGLLLGLPGQSVRPGSLGPLDHGGRGEGAAAVGCFAAA